MKITAAGVVLSIIIIGVVLLAFLGILEVVAISNIRVEFYDVRVQRIGLTSADLLVKLKITNPMPYDTPNFHLIADVYLNGVYVGQLITPETKVPYDSYVFQDSTLTVKYSEGINALLKGSATVTLHGKLYTRILGIIPYERSF